MHHDMATYRTICLFTGSSIYDLSTSWALATVVCRYVRDKWLTLVLQERLVITGQNQINIVPVCFSVTDLCRWSVSVSFAWDSLVLAQLHWLVLSCSIAHACVVW